MGVAAVDRGGGARVLLMDGPPLVPSRTRIASMDVLGKNKKIHIEIQILTLSVLYNKRSDNNHTASTHSKPRFTVLEQSQTNPRTDPYKYLRKYQ